MKSSPFFVGSLISEWAEKAQIDCEFFPSTESTNDRAKTDAFTTASAIKLYTADEQTKGRGRASNSWSGGKRGENMALTFSYRLPFAPQPTLTPLLGLALYRALLGSFPSLEWSLKAPNDVFLKGRKVAGCLTEVVSQGADFRLVFGVGFNIFSSPDHVPSAHLADHWAPLEAHDLLSLLDRLLLEITMSISKRTSKISNSEQAHLVYALNRNPHLSDKIKSISEDGDLHFENRTIKWSEL